MAERLLHEVHLAWRALWRSKAFTLAAVATLGVGTAGATVILTLVQGVLLRPLPVHDQERLLLAWKELPAAGTTRYPFGGSDIKSIAEASQLLESVAAVTANGAARWTTIDDMAAAYVNGALVTGGFFHVLGTTPLLGRALAPADDHEGSEKVLVISAGLWEHRYGRARDVLGRRITLDEQAFTIVGVMPPDIDYPRGAEVWRPAASVPTDPRFGDAARQEMDMIARMRPGVTLAQVTSELRSITRQLEAGAPPNAPRGFLPVARAFEDVVVGNARRSWSR
jgi:putative ABC transport system permease protein